MPVFIKQIKLSVDDPCIGFKNSTWRTSILFRQWNESVSSANLLLSFFHQDRQNYQQQWIWEHTMIGTGELGINLSPAADVLGEGFLSIYLHRDFFFFSTEAPVK